MGRSCQVLSFPVGLKAQGKSAPVKPPQCPPPLHVGKNHVKRTNKREKNTSVFHDLYLSKQPMISEELFYKYNTQWGFFYYCWKNKYICRYENFYPTAAKSNLAFGLCECRNIGVHGDYESSDGSLDVLQRTLKYTVKAALESIGGQCKWKGLRVYLKHNFRD